MIYLKCPTCGTILGDKQIIIDKKLSEIENNPNIDDEEKKQQKTNFIMSLGLRRYCCTMRIITAKNKIDIIL